MRIKAINTLEIRFVDEVHASFESTLNTYIEQFENSTGCLAYCARRSVHDPLLWTVSGYWDGTSTMTEHFCSDAIAELTELLVAFHASLAFGTFEPVLVEDKGNDAR